MKIILWLLLVLVGCCFCIFGIQLAHYFYEFPILPNILTVTFWKDTIAFIIIAIVGIAMMVIGIVRLINHIRCNT